MGCTTMLVGRLASNDGSTIIARNEDCENGTFIAKTMRVVKPDDQPRSYQGVNSHLTIALPDDPQRYTCIPNVDESNGIWGEAGINASNVAMSATETISSNPKVLGADPLVVYRPAKGDPGDGDYEPACPGGIGEEDLLTIVLPYIHTAREGVKRMGSLLEQYGTYEMNGVAFADESEIWYIETIGGHHWIARRVPDDQYVIQPNRCGIDRFDLYDAFGSQRDYMCSEDLVEWMARNHLDVTMASDDDAPADQFKGIPAVFNPRDAFSSRTWLDMIYNNPRAWYLFSTLNPTSLHFHGPDAIYHPQSMNLPWSMTPEVKISAADVKDMLSRTYDGTIYDCYGNQGTPKTRHQYRNIGINRTCECSVLQIRPYAPKAARAVQWVAMGSGPFNTAVAFFTNVTKAPAYLTTDKKVTTESLYWANRLIAALADPEYFNNMQTIESYRQQTLAEGYASLTAVDEALKTLIEQKGLDEAEMGDDRVVEVLEAANQRLADSVHRQTDELLASVLFERSLHMANAFGASDH